MRCKSGSLSRNLRRRTAAKQCVYSAREEKRGTVKRRTSVTSNWCLDFRFRCGRGVPGPRFRGFLDYVLACDDACWFIMRKKARKRREPSHCYSRAGAGNGSSRLSTRHDKYPRIAAYSVLRLSNCQRRQLRILSENGDNYIFGKLLLH